MAFFATLVILSSISILVLFVCLIRNAYEQPQDGPTVYV